MKIPVNPEMVNQNSDWEKIMRPHLEELLRQRIVKALDNPAGHELLDLLEIKLKQPLFKQSLRMEDALHSEGWNDFIRMLLHVVRPESLDILQLGTVNFKRGLKNARPNQSSNNASQSSGKPDTSTNG